MRYPRESAAKKNNDNDKKLDSLTASIKKMRALFGKLELLPSAIDAL